MEMKDIIKDISARGNGSIYLGVVGTVRTGKSTFIKKVIENLVVPNIEDEYDKKKMFRWNSSIIKWKTDYDYWAKICSITRGRN